MVKPSLFIKSLPYNNVVILASDSVISISLRKGIFATGIRGILYLYCPSIYIYFYMYRITLYKEINEIYAFINFFFFMQQLKYGQNARCDAAKKTENTSKNRFKSIYACKFFALYQGLRGCSNTLFRFWDRNGVVLQ